MNNLLKGKSFTEHMFIFAALAFSVGLSTSKAILSLSVFLLALSVLLKGNFRESGNRILKNKLLHPLIAYLSLHVISLLWTSDYGYALHDLKTKLTLLIVPICFTIYPIEKRTFRLLILLFVVAATVTSAINILSWQQFFGTKRYLDIRELSMFGSHIRYGILIAMSAFICVYYQKNERTFFRPIYLLLFCWFCYYTFFSQIISGMLALITAIGALIFWISFQKSRVLGYSLLSVPMAFLLFLIFYIRSADQKDLTSFAQNLPETTVNGNPYTHNIEPGTFIDGKPVLANLCEEELRKSWNHASVRSYDGKDDKGQPIRFTLMRFLTDIGERKDSLGFLKLKKSDIVLIENGMASREEGEGGLIARWNGVRFQLQNHLDPNGHSLLQRIEYWKTAWRIIQSNWVVGVGTGDVQKAFDRQYILDNTPLLPIYRLRAHNTYLTSWLSFGVFGLITILWIILNFVRYGLHQTHPLAFVFILVAASTFFLEDTLETQMGASFFAFFFGLVCSERPTNADKIQILN
jgi:hypothetical protein